MNAPRAEASRDATRVPPRDAGEPWAPLAWAPVLAVLAAIAALADLGINRVAVRTLGEVLNHGQLIELSRWGELPRNLAAIAGLVALAAGLLAFLRTPRYAPVRRRLSIAGFAGIFLPTAALATLLPPERINLQIILFGTGAAHVLGVLVGLTGARHPAPTALRVAAVLAATSCFFAFLAMALGLFEATARSATAISASILLRRIGEVAFLVLPLAAAPHVLPRRRTLRGRIALGVGLLAFFGVGSLFLWGRSELGMDFPVVLYGAIRVELLLESAPELYALPIAVYCGVAAAALVSVDAAQRQAGAGLFLLLAGGYAPRSTGRLLMLALGVTLLARTVIVFAERGLAARAAPEGRGPAHADEARTAKTDVEAFEAEFSEPESADEGEAVNGAARTDGKPLSDRSEPDEEPSGEEARTSR